MQFYARFVAGEARRRRCAARCARIRAGGWTPKQWAGFVIYGSRARGRRRRPRRSSCGSPIARAELELPSDTPRGRAPARRGSSDQVGRDRLVQRAERAAAELECAVRAIPAYDRRGHAADEACARPLTGNAERGRSSRFFEQFQIVRGRGAGGGVLRAQDGRLHSLRRRGADVWRARWPRARRARAAVGDDAQGGARERRARARARVDRHDARASASRGARARPPHLRRGARGVEAGRRRASKHRHARRRRPVGRADPRGRAVITGGGEAGSRRRRAAAAAVARSSHELFALRVARWARALPANELLASTAVPLLFVGTATRVDRAGPPGAAR